MLLENVIFADMTQKTAKRTLSGAESGFHTYALEWTPEFIRSYVDGKLLLTFQNDGKKDKNTWPGVVIGEECGK